MKSSMPFKIAIDWGGRLFGMACPVRMSALKSLSIRPWNAVLDMIIAPQLTELKVEIYEWDGDLLGIYDNGSFCKSLLRFVSEWSKNQNCTIPKSLLSVTGHSLLATSLLLGR